VAIRTTRSLAAFAFICLSAFARADETPIPDFSPGSHDRLAKRVNAAQTTDYQRVLAEYDAWTAAHPADVVSQVERCRFIEVFAYVEDATIESASDDLDACREALKSGHHAKSVEVLLYGVESSWGEDEIDKAKELIPLAQFWRDDQQARLFEMLADRCQWKHADQAAEYAIRAVALDPGSKALMTAVDRWVLLGAKDKARKLLLEAPESTWEKVSRTRAAQVLIDLGDTHSAMELLREAVKDKSEYNANLTLARALAAAGDFPGARTLYRGRLDGKGFIDLDTRVEYFEFERDHGTSEDAVAAYTELRDQGFAADSLARHRLSLFIAHPRVPWAWRDGLGLLALAGAALFVFVFPLVFIVPVHYRGLALRASGRAPQPGGMPWTIRQAWYAFGSFMLVGFVVMYVVAMPYLEAMLPWANRTGAAVTDRVLARLMLWSTIGSLVVLLPLLRGRSLRELLLGRWSVTRSILIGAGCALLLKFLAVLIGAGFNDPGLLGSDTVRSIQGMKDAYGLVVMLLMVAVLTPIVEEVIFRGALLGAFRGYVSFGLAAFMQALALVLMHEEWTAMPFLFVFALVAAWLVKRSEGLLAPMVLHAVNNLTVALAIIGATNYLNQ
jgi:membrane protease YdiL (CAAX protease family)/tetratricopeptide (TPR) repeat protein